MWNYSFVIPEFMILLILLAFYFSRPQISIRVNRTFLGILLLQTFVIMFDLLSSQADEMYASLPSSVLYALNMAYFVLFLARIFWFFLFTADALGVRFYGNHPRQIAAGLVFLISEGVTLSSLVTGAVFRIGPSGYEKGPWYDIVHLCYLFYILYAFYFCVRYRKNASGHDLLSIIAALTCLLVGLAARFLLPQVIIMNVFCLMAIIIIYLSFMNPDLYGSDRGPTFNIRAFRVYTDEEKDRRPFRILGFVLHNYTDEREIYGYDQMDHGITLISEYLNELCPEYTRFYLRNGCFAIFGPESMDWDALQKKITGRFQSPWSAKEADLFLNISFVRMSSKSDHEDTNTMINRLLSAYAEAGRKPGGTILIDLDEIDEIDRQVDVKRNLERCIENDDVQIFLQPLIECKSGQMIGAEVLARIFTEDGKMISPGQFIPIAEQNGQINRMGAQVFEKACRFIHAGYLEETGMQWLNVNLSPIQCMKRDLADEFSTILKKYNVRAEQIHLEITEASMIDFSVLQQQIHILRKNGFQFALDDYGSGYSNLTRVKHYPFINIKLDMEVVWDYFRDRDLLLPAIVQAFKQLKFTVTAEGIESKEMAELMTEVGCDYLQGYYFSKPMPNAEFLEKYRIAKPEQAVS